MRYSSFGVISMVKSKRDQIFEEVSLMNVLPHYDTPPSGAYFQVPAIWQKEGKF